MDMREPLHKFFKKVINIWSDEDFKRNSRITYDIVWNVILFVLIIGFISVFLGLGIGAGYFASLVKDEPIRSYEEMEKNIYNLKETSKLYAANDDYIADIRSDLHREKINIENVSNTLIHAVIATEDQYFKEHNGVVPRAIVRAIVQEATNSDSKSGGSTLTQQIIKNQILTNEVSFNRKAKEILLALRLERFFNKDEILESYLNIIPYGRDAAGENIAGIQTAAQGIFNVNAKDLSLPQAAYLAGLPQSPSTYTPFKNNGGLKEVEGTKPGINRMKTVLKRMYDSEYITKEEYDSAIDYDITEDFRKNKSQKINSYPALAKEIRSRAKDILIEVLAKEDGYSLEDLKKDASTDDSKGLLEEYELLAERAIEMNGYHIHSTINKDIYDKHQDVAQDFQYYGPDREVTVTDQETGKTSTYMDPVQASGMLIENNSGKIISFVGSREFSEEDNYNYATQAKRLPGSTIKPILDYAPAMEKGKVQPGSMIADYPRTYKVPGSDDWEPKNYGGGNYGMVSAREALAKSLNIPAADTYLKIINDDPNPAEEFLEKMGITTLTESDKGIPSLALGSMKTGVKLEEITNAYSTFSNSGKFIDAYLVEKITASDGTIIYEHETEPVDVFSPQTAYLMTDMMRDVLTYGTAASLKSNLTHPNVDWAGKTGTSDSYKDAWFIATNPNVTLGTWIGYDANFNLDYCPGCSLSYSQRNQKLWSELINVATEIDPDLLAPPNKIKRPEDIIDQNYCGISGMLPSDLCKKADLIESDIFNAKHVPTKEDDSLILDRSSVVVDGKSVSAGSKTPSEFVSGSGELVFNPEWLKRNEYDNLGDLTQLYPRDDKKLWEKIGTPKGDYSSNSIQDNGDNPEAPESVSQSGNNLSWSKSSSPNIVGYRIFKASSSGGSFSNIGNTTSTSFANTGSGAYIVKSVDYFGRQSSASNEVIIEDSHSEN